KLLVQIIYSRCSTVPRKKRSFSIKNFSATPRDSERAVDEFASLKDAVCRSRVGITAFACALSSQGAAADGSACVD
ncbi:MAG: hypothetical protein VX944_02455, partial [Myxococcota bacterium]|nr:hypothetical protein [Myxococcota bacterium]